EAKRKMSLARKGKISWNRGKHHTKKHRKNLCLARQGRIFSKETRMKMSLAQMGNKNSLGCKPTKETIRKRLIRKTPSSLEKKMIDIIKKLNLPYKFVGNGEFFIERKCPDFINVNGEKIAIEVFYRKHKEEFRKGLENWKKERSKIFAKYGWKLIFLNEVQVNEDYIKDVIGINPK
ncbi:MAG: NUMOD3 domain-containing DNA-binding protein, partial [Candidatus Heimdallarchaeaceae archaeon]